MALYAIGDIHGRSQTLLRLVDQFRFDPAADRLWLTGDLVNRGPGSAATIRWAMRHDRSIVSVLGNHDLHLLHCAAGSKQPRDDDTFGDVLRAGDRDELIDWLRRRPLVHAANGRALVHAALDPRWSVAEAAARARELEAALASPDWRTNLEAIAAGVNRGWDDALEPPQRWRTLTDIFTRLRCVKLDGSADYDFSGTPEEAPDGLTPWYRLWRSWTGGADVIFGHWAAHGFRMEPGVLALDSGAAWERELTAVRLDDGKVFQERATD